MSHQTSRRVLIAATIVIAVLFALIELFFRPDFIAKTVWITVLYMIPAFVLHKCNEHILYSEFFTFPGKPFWNAFALGIGTFMLVRGALAAWPDFLASTYFPQRLKSCMGSYADMALAVTVYLALADSLMTEFFFRGFCFFNLSHLADKQFSHLFCATVYALFTAIRTFGIFSAPLWIGWTVLSFGISLLFTRLYLRTQTIYHSCMIHLGFNLAVYMTALQILGI